MFVSIAEGPTSAPSASKLSAALSIMAILVIVGLLHAYNLFGYPYFEDDEGTYMGQAWAVLHQGALAPYTYWYDHSPVGWIQLAGLLLVTNVQGIFPSGIPSGRALMLLYQLGSTVLVFAIARRGTGKLWLAVVAALLFGLSPWGIYYHRRVLLDNVATFWMLLAFFWLATPRLRPMEVWFAAISIGLAILSKEVIAFIIPAFALIVGVYSTKANRILNLASFAALSLAVVSFFPLMAVLKGELLPATTTDAPHVSLLCTAMFQAARGKDGGILSPSSQFWWQFWLWARQEPVLVYCGTVAAAFVSAFGNRMGRLAGLVALSLWAFLARGGIVIGFYLVPLIPVLALSIVEAIATIRMGIGRAFGGAAGGVSVAILVAVLAACAYANGPSYTQQLEALVTNHEADAMWSALDWVRKNVEPNAKVVIDQAMWANLHDGVVQPTYPNAHYYWKVEKDPAISIVYDNSWKNIQYLVTTPQLTYDVGRGGSAMPMLAEALSHSSTTAQFNTGGWEVEVRRVDPYQKVVTPSSPPPTFKGDAQDDPHVQHTEVDLPLCDNGRVLAVSK